MLKRFLATTLLLIGFSSPALAANCSPYPYTLTNGTTADANQVMSNFNSILNCGNTSLAKNGANSDITSLAGLTTPLAVAEGGSGSATASGARTNFGLGAAAVEALGGNVVDDGSGNLSVPYLPNYHVQIFTSSGTFTVPAGTTAGTVFRFTAVGGGGGGGDAVKGASLYAAPSSGGGSGGAVVAAFHGFTALGSVTITVAGATAHAASGGSSTVAYSAVDVITAAGGSPGVGASGSISTTNAASVLGGAPGTFTVTAGASGLTLDGSWGDGSQPGSGASLVNFTTTYDSLSGRGGGNAVGVGGNASGTSTGVAGTYGGGGGGVKSTSGTASGGAGGAGVVIVEWWL